MTTKPFSISPALGPTEYCSTPPQPPEGKNICFFRRTKPFDPIPLEDLFPIVQSADIKPNDVDWQGRLTQLLSDHQIITKNILQSRVSEVRKTWGQHLKEFLTLKTMLRISIVATLFFLLLPSPIFSFSIPLKAIFLPPLQWISQSLPIARISSLAPPFLQKVISFSLVRSIVLICNKVLLSNGFAHCFANLPLAYGISFLAYFLPEDNLLCRMKKRLDRIVLGLPHGTEDRKASSFRASIPSELQEDGELKQLTCSITFAPIRYPCQLRCNHIFEFFAIRDWHEQKRSDGSAITCPSCREIFTEKDLRIDSDLSDQIELRILLLCANQSR